MNTHFFLLLLLAATAANAEDFSKCSYHYFKNGKTSSSECYDAEDRWGRAKAFNTNGDVIFNRELRKIGGHSSVTFSYYDNGGVKRASWSSAPDGGIQWYSSVTDFAPDGKMTSYTENNYDHKAAQPLQKKPEVKQPEVAHLEKKDEPQIARCAVIYASEYWFRNTAPYAVTVDVVRGPERKSVKLKPGENIKGGELILAEQFDWPAKFYQFAAHTEKAKEKLIVIPADRKPEEVGKEKRRYYYEVRRII